jgi:hypothetical protein
MDCLTIGLALAVLVLVAFSILGLALDMPAMTWGFGYLALIGSIPVLWLSLSKPIGRAYGARGVQVFNRVLTIAAIADLSLPILVFFVTGALAADSNPAITVPLIFFFNLICAAVFGVWWKRTHRQ